MEGEEEREFSEDGDKGGGERGEEEGAGTWMSSKCCAQK